MRSLGVKLPGDEGAPSPEELVPPPPPDPAELARSQALMAVPKTTPHEWGQADAAHLVGIPASDPPEPDDGIPRSRVTRTCRRYTARALRVLVGELDNPWPAHRIKAAELVLAYGWGKAPARMTEDGGDDPTALPEDRLRSRVLELAQELGIAPAIDVPHSVKK